MLLKNISSIRSRYISFLPALVAIVLFIPFIGNANLFDWDEINFAEIAREMVITKHYGEPQINFQFFTEKPPFFFWLQALCMEVFGINEFSARLPNAVLGILVLSMLYKTGKKLKDQTFGLVWAMMYACMILPHLYFKSGIIDPVFNFFIFSSLYCLVNLESNERRAAVRWAIAGGIFLGLAVLTKGPTALLVIGLTFVVQWASDRFRTSISLGLLIVYAFLMLFTTGLWLCINYLQFGETFIKEFTIRQWELLTTQDAGHGGFFFYHFVVLFFGCFPATAFFIHALLKKEAGKSGLSRFKKWMTVFFWVVLILFTLVKTKIVHYSSLCYYPVSFLASISIYHILHKEWAATRLVKIILILSGLPFILAPFAFAWFTVHIDQLKTILLQSDRFAAENLEANVDWTGWEFIPGLLMAVMMFFSLRWFRQQKTRQAVVVLFLTPVLFLQLGFFFFINRIEAYSQRANIEFWQSHAGEDCYMTSYRYKTYTYYYYGKVRPQKNPMYTDQNWLLTGDIDKTVYISCKTTGKEQLQKDIPDAYFLYNKNGFYFYKRDPERR